MGSSDRRTHNIGPGDRRDPVVHRGAGPRPAVGAGRRLSRRALEDIAALLFIALLMALCWLAWLPIGGGF
jgi:hypothetical protein